MTADIQLPKVTQVRIARLRFVLRDGFDAVEQSIGENALADAQFVRGATHAHGEVMADATKLLRGARQGIASAV